jgi:hypothetical protein
MRYPLFQCVSLWITQSLSRRSRTHALDRVDFCRLGGAHRHERLAGWRQPSTRPSLPVGQDQKTAHRTGQRAHRSGTCLASVTRLTTLECWQERVCRSLVEYGFRLLRHAWLSYRVCPLTYTTARPGPWRAESPQLHEGSPGTGRTPAGGQMAGENTCHEPAGVRRDITSRDRDRRGHGRGGRERTLGESVNL